MSNHHTNSMMTLNVRARGGKKEKQKPICVQDYNDNMAGVDKSDERL
jgi:hypothetical protein